MSTYAEKFFNLIHRITGGADTAASIQKLRFLGSSLNYILYDCGEFYKQKASNILPLELACMAGRYVKRNGDIGKDKNTFSFHRLEVSERMDDELIYRELHPYHQMFAFEDALIMIVQIVMGWKDQEHDSITILLADVSECGFFMVDEDGVPWTIRLIQNEGNPIVSMSEFNQTDELWPQCSVVLSPLTAGEENFLYDLE